MRDLYIVPQDCWIGVRASWQESIKEWRKEGISGNLESAQFSDPRLMVDCYITWLDTFLLNFWVYLISFLYFFFFNFWLCWVFAAAQASHWGNFSCWGAQALGTWASVAVAPGLSCSSARGIFPGSNPGLLHWHVASLPLSYQGSLILCLFWRIS